MVRKKGYFMELVLYKGRPADCSGRLEKEIRTYDLLDALGLAVYLGIFVAAVSFCV